MTKVSVYFIIKLGIIPNFRGDNMNNYSKQREIILNVIKNMYTHPTAEEIYIEVHKIDKRISKSTVYRNINILVDNNDIRKISMPFGSDRYDYFYKIHNHIVCEKCGKVFDFESEIPDKLKEVINSQLHNKITLTDSIKINGICCDCINNSKINN